jgi:hypothetical protein
MQLFSRFTLPALTLLAVLLLPACVYAKSLTLFENPSDTAKVTGTIDLSAGVIPIYTPKDGLWVKIGDPRNGNTGWVKASDLKDEKGNAITFSQTVSDTGNGQSVQMNYGSGKPLTPEQKKMSDEQMLQHQKATQDSLIKAQQNVNQAITEIQKVYQQQMQNMKTNGFPIFPALPSNKPQAVPRATSTDTTPPVSTSQ